MVEACRSKIFLINQMHNYSSLLRFVSSRIESLLMRLNSKSNDSFYVIDRQEFSHISFPYGR